MKRPIIFAIELVCALALAATAAWVTDRFSRKDNRRAQADERIAAALERAYPPPKTLPRPSLLNDGCVQTAVGPTAEDARWSCSPQGWMTLPTLGGAVVESR
jgi:hypothetical protein